MNPSPKIITGPLHQDNKGACDWGYQGFLAHGCHGYIVVVDPKSLQTIQVLAEHKGNVTQVRWCREKYHHAFATGSTYTLQLASADSLGVIKVWDVSTGLARTEFTLKNRSLQGMEWYVGHDESHDLLMTLHDHEVVALWDGYTGVMLWQKAFFESLLSFALNPFDIKSCAILCESSQVLVISDLSVTSAPTDNYRSIQFNNGIPSLLRSTSSSSIRSGGGTSLKRTTVNSWNKVVSLASNIQSGLRGGADVSGKRQSISEDETEYQSNCIQMVYNSAHHDIMYLVFPREIQILDLDADLTLAVIRLDKVAANFMRIFPCRWTDVIYCLHENGCVTVRVRRSTSVAMPTDSLLDFSTSSADPVAMDMTYNMRCQSDALRLLHHVKICNFMCDPVTERSAVIGLSDGRIIQLDSQVHQNKETAMSNYSISYTLNDMIGRSLVLPPSDSAGMKSGRGIILQLVVNGLHGGLTSPATVMKMIPAKNDNFKSGSLLAIGSGSGTVQLVNVYSGQVETEYKLFMSPVRGIQWIDHKRFITYATPDPGPYNRSTNSEVLIVHIKSGVVMVIRDGKLKDKVGPITSLQVSPSREYFAMSFKNKPLEIWNLASGQIVKDVTTDADCLTNASALAWYPYVTKCDIKDEVSSKGGKTSVKAALTEQLFLAAFHKDGFISRISLHNNAVTDTRELNTDNVFGFQNVKLEVTAMCWKKKLLLFGVVSGQLYISNGKNKENSKAQKIYDRPGVKAKSIKFAPGIDNLTFLVHYDDSVDIWNIKEEKAKICDNCPTFKTSVVDAEWVGYASPAILTADGCLHVFDLTFSRQTTSVTERTLADPVFSPGLMDHKKAFLLKYQLQCGIHIEKEDSTINKPWLNQLYSATDSEIFEGLTFQDVGTIQRCLNTARLFGDEFDTDFWRLAQYHTQTGQLDSTKSLKGSTSLPNIAEVFSTAVTPAVDVSPLISWEMTSDPEQGTNQNSMSWVQDKDAKPLEPCFDVMCDSKPYKMYQAGRLDLQNRKRCTYQQKKQCASRYIMLDKADTAVQVLMETDMNEDAFINDCLKACLVSSIHTSNASLGTIKLAATHLIASGKLMDGIELLCLISMRLDACKYFMEQGLWHQAVRLAKTSLLPGQGLEVMVRWAEHLWNNYEKNKSVMVMMSLGRYTHVIQMLRELKQYDRAAMFLQACQEHKLIQKNTDNANFIESVYLDFAKVLIVTRYEDAVRHYCHLAGEKGANFLQCMKLKET